MKLTICGLVLACLSMGALAMPTNMEVSVDVSHMATMTGMAVQNTENKPKEESTKIEATMETSMKMDEMEMTVKSEPIVEPEMATEPKTVIVESPEKSNEMETKKMEMPAKPVESSVNQSANEKELQDKPMGMPTSESPEKPSEQPAKKQGNGKDWEGMDKQSDSWHDFDDKFSLLEDRLPDLTDEEFMEINKEDSIPLNFLKAFDISKEMIKDVKLHEEDPNTRDMTSKPQAKPETPVYITIPIVINSNSILPISLSIGGQEVPLKVGHKDSMEDLAPAPGGQLNKLLNYATAPRRQTNRHRSNLRSKIYARNKRHQVTEFKRDIE